MKARFRQGDTAWIHTRDRGWVEVTVITTGRISKGGLEHYWCRDAGNKNQIFGTDSEQVYTKEEAIAKRLAGEPQKPRW